MGGPGSIFDNILNALSGQGYADGSSWTQRPQTMPAGNPMQLAGAHMGHGGYQPRPMPPQQQYQPHPAPMAPQPPQFSGWGPMNSQPGMQSQGFQPANLGNVPNIPQIQQPIQGSSPVMAQGFSPFPTVTEMMMARRG